jgi:carbonic anhydrase/acetyltransferase-like protein (isoleucine patch superfamily)
MKPANLNPTYRFMFERPQLGARVFVHPASSVSGSVTLDDDVSVWPMAVLRGDVNRIRVGARSNVQDGSILHVTHEGPWSPEGGPLIIGEDVTVGHGVILHACTINDRCLVGMGAVLLDGVIMEPDSMIGAGSVVAPGKVIPSGTLWRGNPARYARDLTPQEIDNQAYSARHYVHLKDLYLEESA